MGIDHNLNVCSIPHLPINTAFITLFTEESVTYFLLLMLAKRFFLFVYPTVKIDKSIFFNGKYLSCFNMNDINGFKETKWMSSQNMFWIIEQFENEYFIKMYAFHIIKIKSHNF